MARKKVLVANIRGPVGPQGPQGPVGDLTPEANRLAEEVRTIYRNVQFTSDAFDYKVTQVTQDLDNKSAQEQQKLASKGQTIADNLIALGTHYESQLDKKLQTATQALDTKVNQANQSIDANVTKAQTFAAQAETSSTNAKTSEDNAKQSELNAKKSELKAQSIADNMQGLTNAFRIDTSEQGRVITATDSSESVINGLKVFGESTQVQTNGYQLFNKSAVTENHIVSNENGIVKPYRDIDNVSDWIIVNGMTNIICTEMRMHYWGAFYDENKEYVSGFERYGKSINVPSNAYYVRVTVLSEVIDTFMLNEGTELKPYEPFTNCKPAPTPDNPSEILNKTVKEINVFGKNLFDVNKIKTNFDETKGGIINNGDGSLFIKNTINDSAIKTNLTLQELCPALKAGDTVILNYKNKNFPDDCKIYFYEAEYSFRGKTPVVIKDNYLTSKVFLYPSSIANTTTTTTLSDIQIEYGSTPTAYTPYKEPQTVTLTQPITLNGIEVSSDGNVTIDGKQYVSDVITLKDGVYGVERNIGTLVLNGSEKWVSDPINGHKTKRYVCIPLSTSAKVNRLACICKQLKRVSYQNDLEGFILSTNNANFGVKSNYQTLNEFTNCVKANNLDVVYTVETPTFEPLPEADQQAIKALKSNYPTTIVTNNDNAFMQLDYVADTKNYIDNRLSEIKTAIIASKGV